MDSLEKEVLASLRDIGPGLKELARAIEQAPAAVARETEAVRQAFNTGAGTGFFIGFLVALFVAFLARGRRS